MAKPKILFVCPSFQSFVKNDIQILSHKYKVLVNNYQWSRKELAPWYLFQQFWAVGKALFSVDIIVVSFGGYWAFWPALLGKIFNKPTYIILHGTDCASIPELQYGSLRIPLLKWFCKKSYQYATALLPVSESLVWHQNNYFKYEHTQGFRHYFPALKTPYVCIPNGFETDFWIKEANIDKEANSFLAVLSGSQFDLKGGDLILQVAPSFPDCSFYFAGLHPPDHLTHIPSNVYFLGKLDPPELKKLYSKSTFYFQLSVFEGFGCALCEAMLCECIPIVSKVNILPTIVSDCGFILENRDAVSLENIIMKALKQENHNGTLSREHIKRSYPLVNRKEKLLTTLADTDSIR